MKFMLCFLCVVFFFLGCSEPKTAVLWTDRHEFAIYAQYYNTSQKKYKVEVHYTKSPVELFVKEKNKPDIVIAQFLNSTDVKTMFQDVNYLLKKNHINGNAFYSEILKLGSNGKKQYLLPVSFNLPAIVFLKDSAEPKNLFITDLEEVKKAGIAYNKHDGDTWMHIGFSPLWDKDNDLLFFIARLYNADFAETADAKTKDESILQWNNDALEKSLRFIKDWIQESSGSIQAEDDFIYKYFFDPPYKLLADQRILFDFMKSSDYFTLHAEQSTALDFRWLSRAGQIPVSEDITDFGIYKNAQAKKAAADFACWFFNEDTQDLLLGKSKSIHLNELVFGIAGGFSSMQTVTEFVFPKYYSGLLGHTPPADFLVTSNALPANWLEIKQDIIIPYMLTVIKESDNPRTLQERINDWQRIKQGQF